LLHVDRVPVDILQHQLFHLYRLISGDNVFDEFIANQDDCVAGTIDSGWGLLVEDYMPAYDCELGRHLLLTTDNEKKLFRRI